MRFLRCFLVMLALLLSSAVHALPDPLVIGKEGAGRTGQASVYMIEAEGQAPLDVAQARAALQHGEFHPRGDGVASFGIGSGPVWMRLAVHNPTEQARAMRVFVGMSWIDQLDVYLLQDGRVLQRWQRGDTVAGAQDVLPGAGYDIPASFPPGLSEIYVRAQTPDPLLLPLTFLSEDVAGKAVRRLHYGYGMLYGFLLALMAYNAMIYLSLRARAYRYYAFYLASFILLNLSYTGHGFALWWPEHVEFQRYVILVMMVLFSISGFLFAKRFLDLRRHEPRLQRWVRVLSVTGASGMTACVVLGSQTAAAWLAFCFMLVFSIVMVLLGLLAVYRRIPAARYFLAAALCGMGGSMVTVTAVWGMLPLNVYTFHGVEFGIVLEAILLALALANRMRHQELARMDAEELARTDSLTGLPNRRAFVEAAKGVWSTALRKQRPLSLIMLDVDHFKSVNDRYGHEEGDRVLVHIAGLLRESCRAGDVPARWGGEEFVMLLPETDLAQAGIFAERMRKAIAQQPIALRAATVQVSASLGIAERSEQTSLEALIREADEWLYHAKAGGRNRVASAPLA